MERGTGASASQRAAAHRNGPVGCARAVHLIIELARPPGRIADAARATLLATMHATPQLVRIISGGPSNCNAKYERAETAKPQTHFGKCVAVSRRSAR